MSVRPHNGVAPVIFSLCTIAVFLVCSAGSDSNLAYTVARKRMVQTQLAGRDISDEHVLKAFEKVERHRFVQLEYQPLAYDDYPLPIAAEQTISQPYIVALMTQLAEIGEKDKVLEIGTGSGYQAAILAELAGEVYTIEIIDTLYRAASSLLKELGYDKVRTRLGDGHQGWPEFAPFDAIVVTCAPPEIPDALIDQLAVGGRMVIPVGTDWQELMLLEKHEDEVTETQIIPVRFVPMTGGQRDTADKK